MKYLTSELNETMLDRAVALAQGDRYELRFRGSLGQGWFSATTHGVGMPLPAYSSQWADGGPLVERTRIQLEPDFEAGAGGQWFAHAVPTRYDGHTHSVTAWKISQHGDTPLVAAMRAFVASKLGDEIELE